MPKVSNYGEVLAHGLGMTLIAYATFGSYQGDYIAMLEKGGEVYIFKGNYGSCSGCDWLDAKTSWMDSTISDVEIQEYVKEEKPFATISHNNIQTLIDAEDMSVFFPANTRNDYADWSWDDIKKMLREIQEKV